MSSVSWNVNPRSNRDLGWGMIGRIPRNRRIKGLWLKFSVGVKRNELQIIMLFRMKTLAVFSPLAESLIRTQPTPLSVRHDWCGEKPLSFEFMCLKKENYNGKGHLDAVLALRAPFKGLDSRWFLRTLLQTCVKLLWLSPNQCWRGSSFIVVLKQMRKPLNMNFQVKIWLNLETS